MSPRPQVNVILTGCIVHLAPERKVIRRHATNILHIEKTRPGKDLNTFSLSNKVDGIVRGRHDYSHRAHASMLAAPHTVYEIRIGMSTFAAFVKQEYDDTKHGVI